MTRASYSQFCPVAMASEVLCTRWTVVLLREFIAGSTRFNDLRRGVPRMSPALLSKRLKELTAAGILDRIESGSEPGIYEYHLTDAGRDLRSVVESVGFWGQRWVEAKLSLKNLDPSLLMWDMHRNLNMTPMPEDRCVIHFLYSDLPKAHKHWWLVVEPTGEVDLCSVDRGFDVDLYVTTDLRTMTSIWMGVTTVAVARDDNLLTLVGDDKLSQSMQTWLGLSPFAVEKKRVKHRVEREDYSGAGA